MAIVKTDSQHYADIAQAIRTKNGQSTQYKPSEMSGAILAMETGSAMSAIIVYAPTGSSITCTLGDQVRTVTENNGIWRFENCALGTWTVTAQKNGQSVSYVVQINEEDQRMRYEVRVVYANVYGICRNITSSEPAWTRTDSSQNFIATASAGAVAGSSDFDSCYPWSGMTRQTLSTGDVMVKIPKFWYKRWREGNMEYIQIADNGAEGFKLHPAFFHNGVQQDAIYVGAYKMSANATSVSGVSPKVSTTKPDFRTLAKGKGTGWCLLDISTVSAIQMLFLVEFATYHSQDAVGRGRVDVNQYSGSAGVTGNTDSVPNLTGCPTGTNGLVDMVWRGIEGLWGNVFEYVDGLLVDCTNKYYYVCNNPAEYNDSSAEAYTALSYLVPGSGFTGQYITQLGLSVGENDHIFLPTAATGGSSTTYICDGMNCSSSGMKVVKRGGRWHSKDLGGLFTLDANSGATESNKNSGARLLYIPQGVME